LEADHARIVMGACGYLRFGQCRRVPDPPGHATVDHYPATNCSPPRGDALRKHEKRSWSASMLLALQAFATANTPRDAARPAGAPSAVTLDERGEIQGSVPLGFWLGNAGGWVPDWSTGTIQSVPQTRILRHAGENRDPFAMYR